MFFIFVDLSHWPKFLHGEIIPNIRYNVYLYTLEYVYVCVCVLDITGV